MNQTKKDGKSHLPKLFEVHFKIYDNIYNCYNRVAIIQCGTADKAREIIENTDFYDMIHGTDYSIDNIEIFKLKLKNNKILCLIEESEYK